MQPGKRFGSGRCNRMPEKATKNGRRRRRKDQKGEEKEEDKNKKKKEEGKTQVEEEKLKILLHAVLTSVLMTYYVESLA